MIIEEDKPVSRSAWLDLSARKNRPSKSGILFSLNNLSPNIVKLAYIGTVIKRYWASKTVMWLINWIASRLLDRPLRTWCSFCAVLRLGDRREYGFFHLSFCSYKTCSCTTKTAEPDNSSWQSIQVRWEITSIAHPDNLRYLPYQSSTYEKTRSCRWHIFLEAWVRP